MENQTDGTKEAAKRARFIAEMYEALLKPENNDRIMSIWEEHVAAAMDKLDSLKESPAGDDFLNDPELQDHYRRAYKFLEKLGRENSGASTPQSYGERHSGPAFFISNDGRISNANNAAHKIIGRATNIKNLENHISREGIKHLQKLVLGLRNPQELEQVDMVRLIVGSEDSIETMSEKLFIAKPMKFQREGPILLYVFEMKIDWCDNLQKILQEAFILSPSELVVAKLLCAGKSLLRIAAERNRSIHTVRSQMKSLIRKTATRSQADLIRLILTLASFSEVKSHVDAPALRLLENNNLVEIKVGNNLIMPVNSFGPKHGRPVLYLHGMLDGAYVTRAVGEMLEHWNIKLIVPTRPGFGTCPSAYDIKTAPEEFANDLLRIMDELEIGSVPVVGHMAGSNYAFAAAAALGRRITEVVCVSGIVPIKSVKQFSTMSRSHRMVAWTARFTPALLPAVLRAGISQIDNPDEEAFSNAIYAQDCCDRRTVGDANIRAAIHAGYRFGVARGTEAYEVDLLQVTRDWSAYVNNTRQPVTLIHGVDDRVVAIDSVRDFAQRHDNISLIEHTDAGQLVFYQKPGAVISVISKIANA